jgi:hypothetical protein
LQFSTVSQVQDSERIVCVIEGQLREGEVRDAWAMSQAQFSQIRPFANQRRHRIVLDKRAPVQIDLEQLLAIAGELDDGFGGQLAALVELEALEMPAAVRYADQGFVADLAAARDVQPLQSEAVARHRLHGGIRDSFYCRNVQCKQTPIVRDHLDQTQIAQFCASR